MSKFQIQVKSIQYNIWFRDVSGYGETPKVAAANTVTELRNSIIASADVRTLSFAQHVRIITDNGDPVERWKIKPGVAKKLRRRY